MGRYGKSNKFNYTSNQIKLGNRTWINEGQLPTTVEQINFGLEPVNKNHKRYIVNKNISSGISNKPLSLQETQLNTLVVAPSTVACGCLPDGSAPSWEIMFNSNGCPYVKFTECSAAVRGVKINFRTTPVSGYGYPFVVDVTFQVCGKKDYVTRSCGTNLSTFCQNKNPCPLSGCQNAGGSNSTVYCYTNCGTTCNINV
jgi:hypothetical protein